MFSFKCEKCGNCFKGNLWTAANIIRLNDVEKWKAQKRNDILKYVCPYCYRLVDPNNNNVPWTKKECPFLKLNDSKAHCRIYETRPEICREFPVKRCNDPNCPDRLHLHSWLWSGKCAGAKLFIKDMKDVIEPQIKI